jgi:phospholipid/cholesterol/gamma-HCH transport system substrate-binding protein
MKHQIKRYAGAFTAVIVLMVLAVVVSVYILSHQRLHFPLVESAPYTLYADFSSGKSVMPGQGQTVRVSGVQIGSIGAVTLHNGIAHVQMNIDPQYRHMIRTDATALLRPRTGLDDMFIEVDPGPLSAPVAKPGFTIPVANTNPPVDSDEILAALDADTRAYLDLLVNGAGQGLKGKGGGELAKLLERFLPTHRDLARLNEVVAGRGAALRRLIHSLQVLNAATSAEKAQIVQLIDSAARVFHSFANANQNVSRAVADLPGTLQQATQTLRKVQTFADILAPAAHNLLPAAQVIPAANDATIALARPAAPIVRSEIRPFVVAARPLVRNLRPASEHLATATPNLAQVFTVLNHLSNLLGYSPGGGQHGYLWWLAWGDHNARTVFSTQDANGDFRSVFVQASCTTYASMVQNSGPITALAYNVFGVLGNAGICPGGTSTLASALRSGARLSGQPAIKAPRDRVLQSQR